MSIWYCKIGTLNDIDLRDGTDWPMRKAIGQAFTDLTGQDAEFCFSGWSAKLTESELAVVENREPVRELATNESPEMLRAELAALRAHDKDRERRESALHLAVMSAVEQLNLSVPVATCLFARGARDMLRQALIDYADAARGEA